MSRANLGLFWWHAVCLRAELRHGSPTRPRRSFSPLRDAAMRTLPDYLRRGMKLVVMGCHPADRWARGGHYYAGRTNPFWPLLYDSGILPESLPYTDDKRLIEFGIGLTDLVKRATRGIGELERQEIAECRILLAPNLHEYPPPLAAFNGQYTHQTFPQRP